MTLSWPPCLFEFLPYLLALVFRLTYARTFCTRKKKNPGGDEVCRPPMAGHAPIGGHRGQGQREALGRHPH